MQTAGRTLTRRKPKQQRSRQTVDYVLEAVPVVVKRHGAQALTTNRIAEAAGVSVGSLYQYFPDKRAIFTALHDRHVDEVQRIIEQTMTDCATAPLDDFARELVLGLVNAHTEVARTARRRDVRCASRRSWLQERASSDIRTSNIACRGSRAVQPRYNRANAFCASRHGGIARARGSARETVARWRERRGRPRCTSLRELVSARRATILLK